jgi:hypothetical protein
LIPTVGKVSEPSVLPRRRARAARIVKRRQFGSKAYDRTDRNGPTMRAWPHPSSRRDRRILPRRWHYDATVVRNCPPTAGAQLPAPLDDTRRRVNVRPSSLLRLTKSYSGRRVPTCIGGRRGWCRSVRFVDAAQTGRIDALQVHFWTWRFWPFPWVIEDTVSSYNGARKVAVPATSGSQERRFVRDTSRAGLLVDCCRRNESRNPRRPRAPELGPAAQAALCARSAPDRGRHTDCARHGR